MIIVFSVLIWVRGVYWGNLEHSGCRHRVVSLTYCMTGRVNLNVVDLELEGPMECESAGDYIDVQNPICNQSRSVLKEKLVLGQADGLIALAKCAPCFQTAHLLSRLHRDIIPAATCKMYFRPKFSVQWKRENNHPVICWTNEDWDLKRVESLAVGLPAKFANRYFRYITRCASDLW